MSSGKVVQVIGAVIDVEFPRDSVPQVYDALTVADKGLTLEVQQQLRSEEHTSELQSQFRIRMPSSA